MSLENPRGPFGPEENQKTTEPHSGGDHVPDEVRERPVGKEYDTPLDVATSEGFVKIPNTPYEGFEEKIPTDQEKEAWRQKLEAGKKKTRKPLYIGLASAAGLAVVGGLFGLNAAATNNESPETPTQPTAEAPVDPSAPIEPTEPPVAPVSPTSIPIESFTPTPVESEQPTAIETEQSGEYTPDELREMDYDTFAELPIETRDILIVDMLKESTEWSFIYGESWDGDTSELYKYNPLDIASETNTDEEIAMQDLYMLQLALSQSKDLDTSGYFDPTMAIKALSGSYIHGGYPSTGNGKAPTDYSEFAYLTGILKELPVVTTHDGPQAIQEISASERGSIGGNGVVREEVAMDFVTVELPESLGGDFKKDSRMVMNKKYIWVEEVNRWMTYKGGVGSVIEW